MTSDNNSKCRNLTFRITPRQEQRINFFIKNGVATRSGIGYLGIELAVAIFDEMLGDCGNNLEIFKQAVYHPAWHNTAGISTITFNRVIKKIPEAEREEIFSFMLRETKNIKRRSKNDEK